MSLESIWFSTLTDSERSELASLADGKLRTKPDVLVVGGGIVGCGLAFYLAEQDLSVQLIEAGSICGQASGANAGGIFPDEQSGAFPDCFGELARFSRDLWGRLAAREGFDFDWRVNGFVVVDPARWENSAEHWAGQLLERGISARAIDAEQVRLLEPNLAAGIAEAIHFPSEAHLHPVKAALSFLRAAVKQGATVTTGTRAIAVEVSGGRVVSVQTTAGRIEPGHVISATACHNDWFDGSAGCPIPIEPISGQMIATTPQPPLLNGVVLGKAVILQLKTGEVLTGGNVVEGELCQPDDAVTSQFAAAAAELIPALDANAFEHAWIGARPATPDRLPVIDKMPTAENLWIAAGHFKNGVLLAPATAKLLAEWLVNGAPSMDLAPYCIDRFAKS